jgi:hypothetical protein
LRVRLFRRNYALAWAWSAASKFAVAHFQGYYFLGHLEDGLPRAFLARMA